MIVIVLIPDASTKNRFQRPAGSFNFHQRQIFFTIPNLKVGVYIILLRVIGRKKNEEPTYIFVLFWKRLEYLGAKSIGLNYLLIT